MQKYGTKLETFAKIRAKASRHAANNPLAVFRNVVSTEDVMDDTDDVARRDDAPDGLPADLRRRCRDRRVGAVREEARPAHRRADPGAGDDHRSARTFDAKHIDPRSSATT